MIASIRVKELVQEQLAMTEDVERRQALQRILIEPRREMREWDYGETGQEYECWVVGEVAPKQTILIYCEQGFGPEFPWGWLCTEVPEDRSLGMDSQWCWYLEEAFVRSGLWAGPIKPGYEEAFHRPPEERFLAE